jgi:hypothetical protein
MQKLAEFVPARYAKPEEASSVVSTLDAFIYEIERPVTAEPEEPMPVASIGNAAEVNSEEAPQPEEVTGSAPSDDGPADIAVQINEIEQSGE